MLAVRQVGGGGRFPRTEISKFHIARYQFAELKKELTIVYYDYFRHCKYMHILRPKLTRGSNRHRHTTCLVFVNISRVFRFCD